MLHVPKSRMIYGSGGIRERYESEVDQLFNLIRIVYGQMFFGTTA